MDEALAKLAHMAGIETRWQDAAGRWQAVHERTVRAILAALDLPGDTPNQVRESMAHLHESANLVDEQMVIVPVGERLELPCDRGIEWVLYSEAGQRLAAGSMSSTASVVSLPAIMEPGYHRLQLGRRSIIVAVTPVQAPGLNRLSQAADQRPWGAVAQIYSLREDAQGFARSDPRRFLPQWIHGSHFGSVGRSARRAAEQGACALALSPSHAMFSADPSRISPYSPSNRLFLNIGYADPVAVFGAGVVAQVLSGWSTQEAALATHRDHLLNWPDAFVRRLRLLRALFDRFTQNAATHLWRRLTQFCEQGGTLLRRHALYETIHGHHAAALGPGHGWRDWPARLHNVNAQAVAQFAQEHQYEVDFHCFAQWLTYESRRLAQADAKAAGMSIGLISDLAIGSDPCGSQVWGAPQDMLRGLTVGAPPDLYEPAGQNWGLSTLSPWGLRRAAYEPFLQTVRAALQHSGGVRIDHIAGLQRLWLIPEGWPAAEGAYLRYPAQALLGLLALEAHRHQALIIGENLGTVSDELNSRLHNHGLLGMRVLWFERQADHHGLPLGRFMPARQWPDDAVAMPTTHDLPTIQGWWQGRDIEWKAMIGQCSQKEQVRARRQRDRDREALWQALETEAVLEADEEYSLNQAPIRAIMAYVARTPCPLALFSLEDLLGVVDQPNMPGVAAAESLVEHPNWIQALPVDVDVILHAPGVGARLQAIRSAWGQR